MARCQECGEARAEHEDPRDPPLDTGDAVLCYSCMYDAAELRIEDLSDEIESLRNMQGNNT